MSDVQSGPVLHIGFDAGGIGSLIVEVKNPDPTLVQLPSTMTSTLPARYALVAGVVTDQYAGQTDDQVLATIAEQVASQALSVAASLPQVEVNLTKLQFMRLFTQAELEGIYGAAQTAVSVMVFLAMLSNAKDIELDNPSTIAGINSMATAGLLSTARAAQILANEPPTQ